ncbi:MAG TPA: glycosyltransferase family 2 protein [Terriglobales bacterium]|nr:glycosyltransferase family 2 protein [Terriglobales bacterium]
MTYFHWIAGSILALAWLSRLLDAALGMPKVADISRPEWDLEPGNPEPRVSIIVPARNEEEHVEQTLLRLLALDYNNYAVIAVNDRSTDRTGAVMDRVASTPQAHGRLRIIHVASLPAGWMGKPHAMWSAANQASGEWLLFTDADVLFKPDSLRRAVRYAESERADHLVLFPRLVMHSPGERMMVAFFQTLFVFGHRPWKVADRRTKDHMGVGAFNLIRRNAYDAIGTYQALRFEVLDDMKLGKLVKNAGYTQRVVFGEDLISLRWVKGVMGMAQNLTKNMFAIVSFQRWRMLASVFTLVFLNLLPFLGIWFAQGWARAAYAVALVSIAGLYVGMSRMSDVPAYYFFLHPVSSAMFAYILTRSMVLTLRQRGIFWRGTFYPLDELKKGMV